MGTAERLERPVEIGPSSDDAGKTRAQLCILLAFDVPYSFYSLHAGPMPALHVEREYRNGGVCGPRTADDRPDPRLPIARTSSPTDRIVPTGQETGHG